MNNEQKKTPFSSPEQRFLKKLSHSLKPIVQVGKNGLTEGLLLEIKKALHDHELIKIQFLAKRKPEMASDCEEILKVTKASLIQVKGNIVSIFLKAKNKSSLVPKEKGDSSD